MSTFTRYFLFQLPGWELIALVLYFLAGRTALPLWTGILLFSLCERPRHVSVGPWRLWKECEARRGGAGWKKGSGTRGAATRGLY